MEPLPLRARAIDNPQRRIKGSPSNGKAVMCLKTAQAVILEENSVIVYSAWKGITPLQGRKTVGQPKIHCPNISK